MKLCRNGKHSLIEVARCEIYSLGDKVVRWCKVCGAIVVDLDVDNRVQAGRITPMKFPFITQEAYKQNPVGVID